MSEANRAAAEHCPGDFGECMVGGNAEEQARRRKIKRRAIAISVALQTAGLAALVIAPLLAKPAELIVRNVTPVPPYSHAPAGRHETTSRPRLQRETIYRFGDLRPINQITARRDVPDGRIEPPDFSGLSDGPRPSTGLNVVDTRVQPKKPEEQEPQKKRLAMGHIDPALLIRRVEPVYPTLPKQLHRSGKVELRAVIATDGSIQSLQVVSGDPLFVQSALDAVRQWRYKPTYLNGQPVEIDTYITVIYTLQQ